MIDSVELPCVGPPVLREESGAMARLTMSEIHAYLDGALSEEEHREVERRLQVDGEAATLLEQCRRHIQELHRLYDGVLEEPVPERLRALLRRPPGVREPKGG